MNPFATIPAEAILDGSATDAYFERTETVLEHAGRNPRVVAEVTADQFPTGEFELLAGVEDVAHLLADLPIDIDALAEGRLFDGGPVLRIEGSYLDFARYETSILGFLSHATAFATSALAVRRAAPETPVVSFGARHVHPALAAVVERSALLAGLDGFSHVAAGDLLGREASGTMPHSLLICFGPGNQEAAWRAFDEALDPDVPRVALCDTFSDEKDEVLRAVDALGDALESVRIDTTGSRRGDFRHILRELRWELDLRGREDVGLFASGGLGPDELRELRDVVDGFGVGSAITSANPVDFALDIVSVDGEPISKRGKLAGVKEVYRTPDGAHHVVPATSSAPAGGEALLQPLLRDGEIVADFDLDESIERARADVDLVYGDVEDED